jgi:subtilisin-like proprotein convertase family protein
MKKATLFPFFFLLFLFPLMAQDPVSGIWTLMEVSPLNKDALRIQPERYEHYQLDRSPLQVILEHCPTRSALSDQNAVIVPIPCYGKGLQQFSLFETPVMEAELQAKYPTIRTYTGYQIDDPRHTIKLDLGPHGFHAMIFSPQETIVISPAVPDDQSQYLVFRKQDLAAEGEDAFSCDVSGNVLPPTPTSSPALLSNPTGTELRTYRLAMGATGEYSTFHGGTKELTLAAIVTAMNRVNGIYERDFTITMILVNNTDTLIYLDPATDPYTNNNLGAMLGENQVLCDSLIGNDNYDIGHVFGTAGGGLAGLGVVCGGVKAWGATGLGSPVGDVFSVDYVSHEIGHQFGAGHTFNECGSQAGLAYEPGSGVTIMAYAGLCGSSNLQSTSIDQFHVASYDQVIAYSQVANGNSCPEITPTNNTPPVVEVPEGGFYIPYATPFELTGSAFDMEGDSLTYCWEQFDLGPSVHPDSAVGTAPLFRSWKPVNTPTRIFPRIEDLVNNTNTIGELLPQFGRELNFRMTVRDNHPGGGGADYEQITFFAADSSGHFKVLSPDGGLIWTVGELQTVTWDVANSDQSPVNCQEVNIWLSEDGGFTYPHLIATNRENNGAAVITVPNITGNDIRIKVKAAENIFFDISDHNNLIIPATNPDFTITVEDPVETICGEETASFAIELDSILGFQDPVSLAVFNQPAGSEWTFSDNDIVPPATVSLSVSNTQGILPGDYTLTLQASGTSGVKNIPLTIKIRNETPPAVSLVSPFNGSMNVDRDVAFSWNSIPYTPGYAIEVSESPDFSSLVYNASGFTQSFIDPEGELNPNTIYFWRVKVSDSDCGAGPWSPIFSFQTELLQCAEYTSLDVPVPISGSGTPTEYSSLEINQDILLTDVNVKDLTGVHTWMADLHISVLSPAGDSVILFSNICGDLDDYFLNFDDDAPAGPIPCPATTGLVYQPQEPLSIFNGTNANGIWQIKMFDDTNQDGGVLQNWTLELCGPPINTDPPSISLVPDSVNLGQTLTLSNEQISGECYGSAIEYRIVGLPQYGTLLLDGAPLEIGSVFSQADIDNGLLTYVHDGSGTETDHFDFILSCENGGYIGGLVYEITVFDPVNTSELSRPVFRLFPNPAEQNVTVQLDQYQGAGYEITHY